MAAIVDIPLQYHGCIVNPTGIKLKPFLLGCEGQGARNYLIIHRRQAIRSDYPVNLLLG
jgi:hypothetical protein